MYDDLEWTKSGATLSDKAATKEYGLSRGELLAAMRAGKLQYRQQNMHGNPWFRLLRREVEELVAEARGEAGLEVQKLSAELAAIEKELRSLQRKSAKLELRRKEIQKQLNR